MKAGSATSILVWQHVNCLSRSVPEIHSHVAGTFNNQPTSCKEKIDLCLMLPYSSSLRRVVFACFVILFFWGGGGWGAEYI